MKNVSNLTKLAELRVKLVDIRISDRFLAGQLPNQLTSLKRLTLSEYRCFDPNPFDGLAWCRAIAAVFPALEELYLNNSAQQRVEAIGAHVHVLGLKKCQLNYRL